MSIDLSKLCADFMRKNHASRSIQKLKASHARELVAAFFGYNTHAALMADKIYPLSQLEEAHIFIPDISLMELRRAKLSGLPAELEKSFELSKHLSNMLAEEGLCTSNAWLYDTSLENYIQEVLLPDCQNLIDDQLSGVMAETNAGFYDEPEYEEVQIETSSNELVAIVTAQYKGESLDDKPFNGDTLDMVVKFTFPRLAGKCGFYDFELEVGAHVKEDWVDPDLRYSNLTLSNLARELGITDEDLEALEWETQEISNDDDFLFGYLLTFDDNCPSEILEKIDGLSEDLTIRVSANAFDTPNFTDDSAHHQVPNIRPKDQWLEMTGGFRIGENAELFKMRQSEIHDIRNRIAQGNFTQEHIERLSVLLGDGQDEEDI